MLINSYVYDRIYAVLHEHTKEDIRMKQRNIVVCILLSLVTCGIYGIYWMIVLNDETNALSGRQGTSGGLVFLFSLITCGIYEIGRAHV